MRSSTTLASVTSKKVTYVGRLVNLLSGVPSIKNTSLTIQCSPARPQPTWKMHIEYHTKAITLNLPHSQQYLQNIKHVLQRKGLPAIVGSKFVQLICRCLTKLYKAF